MKCTFRHLLVGSLGFAMLALAGGAQAQSRGGGPSGACCLPSGECHDNVLEQQCIDGGGRYQGDGTSCGAVGRVPGVECDPFPRNDDCEDAVPITTFGMRIPGTTENATGDLIPNCEAARNGFTPDGVWYSVIGTGSIMRVGVCSDQLVARGGRSYLFVFCGDCDELQCIAGDGGSAVQVCDDRILEDLEWCAELGREYLIFVAMDSEPGGDFWIEVNPTDQACDPLPCTAENDECEDAISIGTGHQVVLGTVLGATTSDVESCTPVAANGVQPDVWYSVIGSGGIIDAELCIPEVDRQQALGKIEVYCGRCDALNCVAGVAGEVFTCDENDDRASVTGLNRGDDDELEVSWCSEEGREYFIRVSFGGFVASRNHLTQFILEVEHEGDKCDPEPCGVRQEDFCEDAQPVCPFITYEGHTFDATSAYFDHGGTIDTIFFCGLVFGVYDVWYRYTPAENGLMFVHVEGPPTDFVFGVYDDCDEATGNLLACNVAYHHGVVVWPVQAYETYYIRIAGRNFTRGEFELDLIAPMCAEDVPCNNTHLTAE